MAFIDMQVGGYVYGLVDPIVLAQCPVCCARHRYTFDDIVGKLSIAPLEVLRVHSGIATALHGTSTQFANRSLLDLTGSSLRYLKRLQSIGPHQLGELHLRLLSHHSPEVRQNTQRRLWGLVEHLTKVDYVEGISSYVSLERRFETAKEYSVYASNVVMDALLALTGISIYSYPIGIREPLRDWISSTFEYVDRGYGPCIRRILNESKSEREFATRLNEFHTTLTNNIDPDDVLGRIPTISSTDGGTVEMIAPRRYTRARHR